MIPDSVIADHCLSLYYEDAPKVVWAHLESPFDDDGIRWGIAKIDDCALIAMRGTTTITDTVRDLLAVPDPFIHPDMGPIHAGFYTGVPKAYEIVKKILRYKAFDGLRVVIAGHSLGGAHATLLTALALLDDMPSIRLKRVTFGEPRSGFMKLRSLLSVVPVTAYHNHGDIISDLPINVPLFPYVDSYAARQELHVSPHGMALLWGPFSPHHMRLYREGLK